MAYTDEDTLTNRYGDEIAQLKQSDDALDAIFYDTDAIIDGYLAGRYETPLAKIPPQVREIANEIARYKLWDDRAPEEVRKRYEDAMRRLRDISTGLIVLTINKAAVPSAGNGISYVENDRVFSTTTLTDFVGY